jgi:hypothetical protein
VSDPRSGRFRPDPDTLATRVGDEIVLVHLKTDLVYVLNRTAARVWEHLSAGYDRAEIEHRMLAEYDVTAADLATQIDAMLASLVGDSLIRPSQGSPQ